MRTVNRRLRVVVWALGAVLGSGAASAVWGTTLVPMSDADLVRTSAAIVVGTVRRIQTVERRHGGIVTEVTVRVERRVKGRLRSAKVVVTAPGGRIGDHVVQVFDAPEFVRGERVLVFLKRGAEGRLRTNALALGKYRVEEAPDGRLLARRTEPSLDVRMLDEFVGGLEALGAGEPEETVGTGRVATPAAEVTGRTNVEAYTFMSANPYRWFDAVVTYQIANGDSGIGFPASQTAVANAMAAWTNVPTASLVMQAGAQTAPARSVAGGVCDGVSQVQFDDPYSEVTDMTNCAGVLAIGGYCGSGGTMVVNNTTYYRIGEGDVTINQNVGSCWGATNLSEVLTHEIGHTIGLGHSADTTATMYAYAHFDGRGAVVGADDAAGVTALYPIVSGTSSTTTSSSTSTSSTSSTSTSRTTSTSSSTSTSRTSSTTAVPTTSSTTTTGAGTLATTTSTSSTMSSSTTESSTSTSSSSTESSTSTSRTTSTRPPRTTSTTVPPSSETKDSDGDGVVDAVDECPGTPLGDIVDAAGCSVCPCDAMPDGTPWKSRSAYLRCVKGASHQAWVERSVTRGGARDAVRAGLLSTCGRAAARGGRSEERRVGKECRSRWSPYH